MEEANQKDINQVHEIISKRLQQVKKTSNRLATLKDTLQTISLHNAEQGRDIEAFMTNLEELEHSIAELNKRKSELTSAAA